MGYGIYLPQRWHSRPEGPVALDWNNSLTYGLIVSAPLSAWSRLSNIVNKSPGETNNQPIAQFLGTDKGSAYSNRGTSSIAGTKPMVLAKAASSTTLRTFSLNSFNTHRTTARQHLAAQFQNGVSSTAAWTLRIASNTATAYSFTREQGNTGAVSSWDFGSFSSSTPILRWDRFVITLDSSLTSNNPRTWINNEEFTPSGGYISGTYGAYNIYQNPGALSIGTADQPFRGSIQDFVIWERLLSEGEVRSYYENPYQIYKPSNQIIYSLPAAGNETINTFIGNATAAGQQASISYNQVLSANVGNATAASQQATIEVTQRVDTTVGAATAAGLQATILAPTTIDTQVGNATAAGLPALIIVGADVNTTIGNATAAGQQASIASNATVAAGVGNATAAGQQATIIYDQVLSTNIGNATAAGQQAAISYNQVLAAQTGNAAAAGRQAAISYDQIIVAGVGNAEARGWPADILGAGTVNANIGNAIAQGWQASITEGGGPVTGAQNRIRLRSFTERRRI